MLVEGDKRVHGYLELEIKPFIILAELLNR